MSRSTRLAVSACSPWCGEPGTAKLLSQRFKQIPQVRRAQNNPDLNRTARRASPCDLHLPPGAQGGRVPRGLWELLSWQDTSIHAQGQLRGGLHTPAAPRMQPLAPCWAARLGLSTCVDAGPLSHPPQLPLESCASHPGSVAGKTGQGTHGKGPSRLFWTLKDPGSSPKHESTSGLCPPPSTRRICKGDRQDLSMDCDPRSLAGLDLGMQAWAGWQSPGCLCYARCCPTWHQWTLVSSLRP